jgi:hypothetical protein
MAASKRQVANVAWVVRCPLCKVAARNKCVDSLGKKLAYDEVHFERKNLVESTLDAIRSV